MATVPPKLVKLALDHCDPAPFEKYAQTVFGAVIGHRFKPLGGYKDGGADGFVDADLLEDASKPAVFFQASKEVDTEGKIRRTVKRLKEFGRDPRTLYYASSRQVSHIDKVQVDLSEEMDVNVRIYDAAFFEQHANHNDDVRAAFAQYLQPALAFLAEVISPSYPSSTTFKDSRVVSAFLGQEVERRLGTTRMLEGVCDSLILWALEGTDPAKGILLTSPEIVTKVENAIPTARQFFRGQVQGRLRVLSKKINGVRAVSISAKQGRYSLPFESRQILDEHTVEDERLKSAVTSSFESRILAAGGGQYGANLVSTLVAMLHRTLESLFERQGFEAARHFLSNDDANDSSLESRPIIDIAEEQLNAASLSKRDYASLLLVMKAVLSGVFYDSNAVERTYCSRLARTYMLLFTIRNTPEIVEYFNAMSKNFVLYVGSDLLVRAISEYYLKTEDQMTVNALKIIKQAGSKLVLTEAMLEEVHSHIHAAHREYEGSYAEIDSIVDRDLASQSDRILIRAYFYAKLDFGSPTRPRTWSQYLNNFLSADKLIGPTSPGSMRALRDTLCQRFGLDFEPRSATETAVDKGEVKRLAARIRDMRPHQKKDVLADNDAFMILRVDQLRREKEQSVGNPYGYKHWYLTQDTISNVASSVVFNTRRGVRYVMRPEFLINYIAFNPSNAQVRESLTAIFPSVLGVRLGSRLDKGTLDKVLQAIKKAHEVDPARATAIVAEHSDALKSDGMRDFAIKYGQSPSQGWRSVAQAV